MTANDAKASISVDTDQVLGMLRKKAKDVVGNLLYENAVLEAALSQANAQLAEATAQRDALSKVVGGQAKQKTAEAPAGTP